MSRDSLRKLRRRTAQWFASFLTRGSELTSYVCVGCHKSNETPRPTRRQCGGKGHLDACLTCPRCGTVHLVAVYPNGRTLPRRLPGADSSNINVVGTADAKELSHG